MKREYWQRRMAMAAVSPKVGVTLYEKRNDALAKDGFLWWERFWLNQHSITSPALKSMRRDRRALKQEFIDQKKTYQDYAQHVRDIYNKNKWYFNSGAYNPFKLVEFYHRIEDIAETPQPKRRKIAKDYKRTKKTAKSTYTARDR